MDNWTDRCHKYTLVDGTSGFQINFAGMNFTDADIENMSKRFVGVHEEMLKIERGEIKNPDEHRKVTHFTDRSVYTGSEEYQDVEAFVEAVRTGKIVGSTGKKFEAAFINGIGGSTVLTGMRNPTPSATAISKSTSSTTPTQPVSPTLSRSPILKRPSSSTSPSPAEPRKPKTT